MVDPRRTDAENRENPEDAVQLATSARLAPLRLRGQSWCEQHARGTWHTSSERIQGPDAGEGTHQEAGVGHARGGDVGARLVGTGSGSREDRGSLLRGGKRQSGQSSASVKRRGRGSSAGWALPIRAPLRGRCAGEHVCWGSARHRRPGRPGQPAGAGGRSGQRRGPSRGLREGRMRKARHPSVREHSPRAAGERRARCSLRANGHRAICAPTRFSARASRPDRLPRKEEERRVTRALAAGAATVLAACIEALILLWFVGAGSLCDCAWRALASLRHPSLDFAGKEPRRPVRACPGAKGPQSRPRRAPRAALPHTSSRPEPSRVCSYTRGPEREGVAMAWSEFTTR